MYNYLALGDSYTCGTGVAPQQSFPRQLVAAVRERGIAVADPVVVAEAGWTTRELQTAIDARQLTGTFDLVTLLIGVNDQFDGLSKGCTLETYQADFATNLRAAITFAGSDPSRVIVLSIPDWSVIREAEGQDRAAIAAAIDAHNAANKRISQQAGVRYVDITPISRKPATDPAYLASDGRHLSPRAYAEFVAAILPELPFYKKRASA